MTMMTALSGSWRPRPSRGGHALVLALLGLVSLSACGDSDDDSGLAASTPDAPSALSPSPPSDSRERDAEPSDGMPIRISFGDTELAGRLLDNSTARDLAAQLPLTLTFRDHNHVEKTAALPRALSTDGAPAGHDPAAGDIGYWAPGGDFVLYYDDAPSFQGIVRIGTFTGNVEPIERLPEASRVTIARAG